jgi:L-lactate dehydrogenase complex protein LldG
MPAISGLFLLPETFLECRSVTGESTVMSDLDSLLSEFTLRDEEVSAVVRPVASLDAALDYVVDLCAAKEACQWLLAGCEAPLSTKADNLCTTVAAKTIGAPGFSDDLRARLDQRCRNKGIHLTDRSLRQHLGGIDVGLTLADAGIADTGTLVIDSSDEEIRLATMISEVHVAILSADRIVATADDLAASLGEAMARPGNFTAFITGASRTADIERVLAIGVHGPLALHILILDEGVPSLTG